MFPLYTYYVNPKEFGIYDVCLETIYLLFPILTFDLRDGAFRLLLEKKDNYYWTGIISYTYRIIGRNILLSSIIYLIFLFLYPIEFAIEAWGMMLTIAFYEVYIQILRGMDRSKFYVYANILNTFLIGFFSIILVVWLQWGIHGIFIANIASRFIVLIGLEFRLSIWKKYFSLAFKDKKICRSLLYYSLPLLPSVICWWLFSVGDRFFILKYLGEEVNGIFAIANKLAQILGVFATIIYQAWQDTAIHQYNSPNRNIFFSRIFNSYLLYLAILLILAAFGVKILFPWIIEENYKKAIYYIYPCFIIVFFYSISTFLDIGYQCSKRTIRIIPAIFIAISINITLNYILIKYYQLYGVIFATIFSFIALFIYRFFDTRRFFSLSLQTPSFIAIFLLIIGGISYYYINTWWIFALISLGMFAVSWIYLPQLIKNKCHSIISIIRAHK